MAFEIKSPPEFTTNIEEWSRETFADGAAMSNVPEKLLNNDVYLKTELERQEHTSLITLVSTGWTGDIAPYSQTVSVPDAVDGMEPTVVSALADGADEATQKAYVKAFGIICGGTAELGNGQATFKVYKKPETDITIGLRGV